MSECSYYPGQKAGYCLTDVSCCDACRRTIVEKAASDDRMREAEGMVLITRHERDVALAEVARLRTALKETHRLLASSAGRVVDATRCAGVALGVESSQGVAGIAPVVSGTPVDSSTVPAATTTPLADRSGPSGAKHGAVAPSAEEVKRLLDEGYEIRRALEKQIAPMRGAAPAPPAAVEMPQDSVRLFQAIEATTRAERGYLSAICAIDELSTHGIGVAQREAAALLAAQADAAQARAHLAWALVTIDEAVHAAAAGRPTMVLLTPWNQARAFLAEVPHG